MDRLNANECQHTCGVFSLLGGTKSGKSYEENEDLGTTSTNDRELNSKRNALSSQPQKENVFAISDWDQDVHSPPNRPNGSGDEEKIIRAVDMETSKRIKALEEALQKQMLIISVFFEKKDKGLEDKLEVIGALLKENNKIFLENSIPPFIKKTLRDFVMAMFTVVFLLLFFMVFFSILDRYQYVLNEWFRRIYTMIFN